MITAASNQKVKNLTALIQKAKARREQDVFVAEGIKMFLEADPEYVKEVYLSRSFYDKLHREVKEGSERGNADKIIGRLKLCSCEILTDSLFKKVSDTQTPQGMMCILRQHHYILEDILKAEHPLLLILEDIQDPGNLGTMIRTAEGAGVDGVIMSKGTVDIYNPKTIRSTMGSIYRVPFLYTSDLPATIRELSGRGVCIYGAHLQGKEAYYRMDFSRAAAFLIGNEGNGLREETIRQANTYLKIPMEGQVESLNAAAAASVLMYEAARQRWTEEWRKK